MLPTPNTYASPTPNTYMPQHPPPAAPHHPPDFAKRQAQEFAELDLAELTIWESLDMLPELREYEAGMAPPSEELDPAMPLKEHAFQVCGYAWSIAYAFVGRHRLCMPRGHSPGSCAPCKRRVVPAPYCFLWASLVPTAYLCNP